MIGTEVVERIIIKKKNANLLPPPKKKPYKAHGFFSFTEAAKNNINIDDG